MKKAEIVAYYRVSTDKQGRSGLGLDAQRQAIANYINGGVLLDEFVEVESGRKNSRPELTKALDLCKRKRATLVIAKLDRLARNVAFIANLMDAGVDFIAVDMPEANRLTLHIMAAMAEHESRMVSERTKAALQAAKKRGRKLGWAIPTRADEQRQASRKGVAITKTVADQFAANVLPIIRAIEDAGISSLQGIADALNARGIQTARKRRWYAATVKNLLERAGRFEKQQEVV